MSVTTGIPRDVLRAQQKAVAARKKAHRERAFSMTGESWRPFAIVPAAVHCDGDPMGIERPSSQCVRLDDGSWKYVGADAEDGAA